MTYSLTTKQELTIDRLKAMVAFQISLVELENQNLISGDEANDLFYNHILNLDLPCDDGDELETFWGLANQVMLQGS